MLCSISPIKSQKSECGYQAKYDSITNRQVYTFVEDMPIHPKVETSIKGYIAEEYGKSSKVGIVFMVKLEFVISDKGKLIGARIYTKKGPKNRSEYTEEERRIIDILNNYPIEWIPGICSGKKVNVLLKTNLSFVVLENGKLR